MRRFWAGTLIQASSFKSICKVVGIDDWESIVDFSQFNECEGASPISEEKTKKRWIIELEVDFETIDPQKLHTLMTQLSEVGNPTMRIVDVAEGSIQILFEGTQEDFEQLCERLSSNDLSEFLGVPIRTIISVERNRLAQWIRENDGVVLQLDHVDLSNVNLNGAELNRANLNGADLSHTDLNRADLRSTNLSNANLRSANLSSADLICADLHDADLFDANLCGADLSRANLCEADLSRVDLRGADLIGTNLHSADLFEANLRGADLRGADLREARVTDTKFGTGMGLLEKAKQDLKERGAIFDDSLSDRELSRIPVPSGY